jgi:transposase
MDGTSLFEDLRERFCRALDRGMSARGAARHLEVSASTGVKWAQQRRATGTLSAKPMGGRARRLSLSEMQDRFPPAIRKIAQRIEATGLE